MALRLTVGAVLILALAGCLGRPEPAAVAPAPATAPAAPAAPRFSGPVLAADGRCTGEAAGAATAIEPGIGECDLVRLKGQPPTDVLIGESGRGGREVQVLYNEPGGRELYFFVDNRLERIVR
jgi:hypothetical protein